MVHFVMKTYAEVTLKSNHLIADERRLEHRNGGLLEGVGSTTVEVTTARADTVSIS